MNSMMNNLNHKIISFKHLSSTILLDLYLIQQGFILTKPFHTFIITIESYFYLNLTDV